MRSCCFTNSFLGGASERKLAKRNSFNSADVIKAARESSQTDTTAFVEKQRQILDEMKSAKSSSHRGDCLFDLFI